MRLTPGLWKHLFAVAAAISFAAPAAAVSITLVPERDATIYSDVPGTQANGAGQFIFTGRNQFGGIRRSLMEFDVAGALPPGSTIETVNLALTVSMTISAGQPHSLHRLTADWSEGSVDPAGNEGAGEAATPGSVTWGFRNFPMPTELWNTPGGDFVSAASGTASVNTGSVLWTSQAGMVADVQQWLDDPTTNFGWILRGAEGTDGTAKRFDSSENPSTLTQPMLIIEFAPLPGDANGDGQVSGADYTIWADSFGMFPGDATFFDGDFNEDGFVTGADYTIWADNFGLMASVPEPGSLALLALAACVLGLQCKRSRWRMVDR